MNLEKRLEVMQAEAEARIKEAEAKAHAEANRHVWEARVKENKERNAMAAEELLQCSLGDRFFGIEKILLHAEKERRAAKRREIERQRLVSRDRRLERKTWDRLTRSR